MYLLDPYHAVLEIIGRLQRKRDRDNRSRKWKEVNLKRYVDSFHPIPLTGVSCGSNVVLSSSWKLPYLEWTESPKDLIEGPLPLTGSNPVYVFIHCPVPCDTSGIVFHEKGLLCPMILNVGVVLGFPTPPH